MRESPRTLLGTRIMHAEAVQQALDRFVEARLAHQVADAALCHLGCDGADVTDSRLLSRLAEAESELNAAQDAALEELAVVVDREAACRYGLDSLLRNSGNTGNTGDGGPEGTEGEKGGESA